MVAFLRAVNTGGRRVRNPELVAALADAGLHDVAAFQASGNVGFDVADGAAPTEVRAVVEGAIRDRFGWESPAFLRTCAEVAGVAGAEVFDADEVAGTEGRVQVGFLHARPDRDALAAVTALVPDDDLVRIVDRELWWLPRAGISTSALRVPAVEAAVGGMTVRTQGAVGRIAARLCGPAPT